MKVDEEGVFPGRVRRSGQEQAGGQSSFGGNDDVFGSDAGGIGGVGVRRDNVLAEEAVDTAVLVDTEEPELDRYVVGGSLIAGH